MEEEWRDIIGYEGLYQVSNLGRIKSLNYRGTGKEGILSPILNKKGYLVIGLCKNNKQNKKRVNRLVAQAFIPNPENLPEVNHKDENRINNCVDNLEWCTREYNINYGTRSEKVSERLKGTRSLSDHPRARKVKCITTGETFDTIIEASEKYSVCKNNICRCCRGKSKSAGKHPVTGEKLVWKYV